MSEALLPAVRVGPAQARYSIIWLYGLGADGHDFEPIVPDLHFKHKDQTRFVFPHAPSQAVTLNNGYVMPAWYDLFGLTADAREDEAGIRRAERRIQDLLAHEIAQGVPAEHIILAGFSQGGAIALHTGLRYPQKLAGILALSTYLPIHDKLAKEASAANQRTPIFMAHGSYDPVVSMALAELSREQLIKLDYKVDWRTYPMEHGVLPDEIDDISRWLDKLLP
jgi:phospholipase/carboxylesterase